ncbi:MAG: DNA polymerase III subunit delta' [Bacteroidales bacterium]|nr:DNA polymerase III subunit delta' [Bacteroidales bacterium]
MRFGDIIGNSKVADALVSMADSGRVAHAMLLYENDGCGALPLALAYVQYLNCANPSGGDSCGECQSCRQMSRLIHPDVHFVYPVNKGPKTSDDKPVSESYVKYWRELVTANPYFVESLLQKAIGIEGKTGLVAVAEAKSIIGKLSLASVSGGYKAVIFYLPEKMNQQTANMLLKLVEEPPEKTLFLFITHAPEKVLQTIFSRCQSVRVLPCSREEVERTLTEKFGIDPSEAVSAAAVSGGSVGAAMEMLGEREEHNSFLDMFSDMMGRIVSRDLLGALECGEAAASLESREKQKAFCIFAGDCIRKLFMIKRELPQIAGVAPEEMQFYSDLAGKCTERFLRKAASDIEGAAAMIDRNVNSKIVFCDLVNRMYLNIM